MVHTYVAGPNIAKGAECDENVSTLRRSLITSPAKNAGAGQQQQQKEAVDRCRAYVASTGAKFGQPWVPSSQSSSPLIKLNAALAPEWTTALDIGRQVMSGNPIPGSPGAHCFDRLQQPAAAAVGWSSALGATLPAAAGDTPEVQRYQPPVELVVLPSAVLRLGPSTPWRYTAGQLAHMGVEGQQPPLSPGRTRLPHWTADAGTQTAPPHLQRDSQAMHRGSPTANAAAAAQAAAGGDFASLAALQQQQPEVAAAAAPAGAQTGRRRPSGIRALECNPWELVLKHKCPFDHTGLQQPQPWVPPSSRAAADWVIQSAAATAAGTRQQRPGSAPAAGGRALGSAAAAALANSKAAAAARRAAAVKYAALGRRAALVREEGLAAAAATAVTAAAADDGSSDAGGSCCCCRGGSTVVCVTGGAPAAAAVAANGCSCCCCSGFDEGGGFGAMCDMDESLVVENESTPPPGLEDDLTGLEDDITQGIADLLAEVSTEFNSCCNVALE